MVLIRTIPTLPGWVEGDRDGDGGEEIIYSEKLRSFIEIQKRQKVLILLYE